MKNIYIILILTCMLSTSTLNNAPETAIIMPKPNITVQANPTLTPPPTLAAEFEEEETSLEEPDVEDIDEAEPEEEPEIEEEEETDEPEVEEPEEEEEETEEPEEIEEPEEEEEPEIEEPEVEDPEEVEEEEEAEEPEEIEEPEEEEPEEPEEEEEEELEEEEEEEIEEEEPEIEELEEPEEEEEEEEDDDDDDEEEEEEEPEEEEPEEEELPEIPEGTLFSLSGEATLNLPLGIGKLATKISARLETGDGAPAAAIAGATTVGAPPMPVSPMPAPTPAPPTPAPTSTDTKKKKQKGRLVFEAEITKPIKFLAVEINKPKVVFATDGTFELTGGAQVLKQEVNARVIRKTITDPTGKKQKTFEFRGELVSKKPLQPFKAIPIPAIQSLKIENVFVGIKAVGKEKKFFFGGTASILDLPCEVELSAAGANKISVSARPPEERWDLSKISPALVPLAKVLTDFSIIVSSYPFLDSRTGVMVKPGITFAAKLDPMGLPGMDKLFKNLPVQPKPAVFAGTLGRTSDMSFTAIIPIEVTLMSRELLRVKADIPKVVLKSFQFQIAGIPPEISLKCGVEVTPQAKDTPLLFTGAFTIDATGQFGIEASMKGTWNDPYGLRGLMVEDVGFEFGARPGSYPVFIIPQRIGFTGTTAIGDREDPEGHIRTEVTGAINASAPQNIVFYASINRLTLQALMAIPRHAGIPIPETLQVPNLGISDAIISFSPLGGTVQVGEVVKDYPAGILLQGKVMLLDKYARALFQINTAPGLDMGIHMEAELSELALGPMLITGAGQDKKYGTPEFDKDNAVLFALKLTPKQQMLYTTALVKFFDSYGNIELDISTKGIHFDLKAALFNIFMSELSGHTTGTKLSEIGFDLNGKLQFGEQQATLAGRLDMEKAKLDFKLNKFTLRDCVESAILMGANLFKKQKKKLKQRIIQEEKKSLKKTESLIRSLDTSKLVCSIPQRLISLDTHDFDYAHGFCTKPIYYVQNQRQGTIITAQASDIEEDEELDEEEPDLEELEEPEELDEEEIEETEEEEPEAEEIEELDEEEPEEDEEEPDELEEEEEPELEEAEELEEDEPEEEPEELDEEEPDEPEVEEPEEEELEEPEEDDDEADEEEEEEGEEKEEAIIFEEVDRTHARPTIPGHKPIDVDDMRKKLTAAQKAKVDEILMALPPISFKDLKFNLKFFVPEFLKKAAKDFEGNGIYNKAKINIPAFNLSGYASSRISKDGVELEAFMKKWKFGPLLVTGRGKDKKYGTEDDGPYGNLTLTTEKQAFTLTGLVDLFGTSKSEIFIDMGADTFTFDTKLKILGTFDANIHAETIEEPKGFKLDGLLRFGKQKTKLNGFLGDESEDTVFLFHLNTLTLEECLHAANSMISYATKQKPIPVAQLKKTFPVANFGFENVHCGLAMKKTTYQGKEYQKGLSFEGKAILPIINKKFHARTYLGKEGVEVYGHLKNFNLGPLKVTGAGPDEKENTKDDGPLVQVKLQKKDSKIFMDGYVEFFDSISKTKIDISKEGFAFETRTKFAKLFDTYFYAKSVGKTQQDLDFIIKGEFESNFYNELKKAIIASTSAMQKGTTTGVTKSQRDVTKLNRDIKKLDNKIAWKRKKIAKLKQRINNKIRASQKRIEKAEKRVIAARKKVRAAQARIEKAKRRIDVLERRCRALTGFWNAVPRAACWAAVGVAKGTMNALKRGVGAAANTGLNIALKSLRTAKKLAVLDPKALKERSEVAKVNVEIAGLQTAKRTVIGLRNTAHLTLEASKQIAAGVGEAVKKISQLTLTTLAKMLEIKKATLEGSLKAFTKKGILPKVTITITTYGKTKTLTFEFDFKDAENSMREISLGIARIMFG